MNREIRLFSFYGLTVTLIPAFFAGSAILLVLFSLIGTLALGLPVAQSVIGAGLAATLMWMSELIHQFGHAVAARAVGHPMIGISLGRYLFLGGSVYPTDEEDLTPTIHMLRATGGPVPSLIVSAILFPIALGLQSFGGMPFAVAAFLFGLNFFAYTLQVFLPLGFNDGAVFWRYGWGRGRL